MAELTEEELDVLRKAARYQEARMKVKERISHLNKEIGKLQTRRVHQTARLSSLTDSLRDVLAPLKNTGATP